MTDKEGSLIARWSQFTLERFSLLSHLPMVACFTLGNFAMAAKLTDSELHWERYAIALVITLMTFFRLRCFDEIKDYQVDLTVNPTRPLARGLLRISEVKTATYVITALELLLGLLAGPTVLFTHGIVVAYSFLMYREFFIGRHLRPHLTTYAVTHTFISMLIGWSIAASATNHALHEFPRSLLLLGPVNWMLFNLFEFARKTFAPEEERKNVESYSSIFGPLGASALSLSQIGIALFFLTSLSQESTTTLTNWSISPLSGHLVLALLPLSGALYYMVRRRKDAAGFFRGFTGAYLVLFYILLAWQGLG